MKHLMIVLVFVICIPAYAGWTTSYALLRKGIEQYCATNSPNLVRTSPENERVFVSDEYVHSCRIVAYHKGMTLKDVGITSPNVFIFHPAPANSVQFPEEIRVDDHLDLKIEDMDVIYASDGAIF
jgi:hypothetical protein